MRPRDGTKRQPPPISIGVIDTVSGMPSETASVPVKIARVPSFVACVTATRTNRCFHRSVTSTPAP